MTGGDEKVQKIDTTSPFYLGSNDGPGNIITTVVFHGNSYEEWSRSIRLSLMAGRKFDFLDGSIQKPTDKAILVDWRCVQAMLELTMVQTRSKTEKEFAMVETRSMSKRTDTKIAVNHKVVERASKQTRKKEKMNSKVKVTRAKSGTTKKVDTKNADCYERPRTIDDEAWCIFMIEDYLIRHPLRPNAKILPVEVDYAGQSEWKQMSALDKAPFIKTARERRAKPAFDPHAW